MKSISHKKVFLLLLIATNIFYSCKKDPPVKTIKAPTPYNFVIPKGFPTNVNIPANNPLTVEGVKLGHYLYYDDRLSGRADEGKGLSCSSCHKQINSFENGTGKGIGVMGIETDNVMLPHINLAWNPGTFAWNGGASSIEEDIYGAITLQSEFASTWEKVVAALSAVPEYPAMFEAAFGTKVISKELIAKAIGQFVRSMVSSDSKLDKVLRGEYNFTNSERNGMVLFTTESGADCFHCHGQPSNPLMTTNLFYNNAKDSSFNGIGDRYSVTGNHNDIGAYKAPTLRNVELTGPYMHDGRFKTLDEVINFYREGLVYSEYAHPLMHKVRPPYGHGAALNPQQKADLKAFLLCLTDTSYIHNPNYAKIHL